MVAVPLALILCAGSQAAERSARAGRYVDRQIHAERAGPGLARRRLAVARSLRSASAMPIVQTVSAKVTGESHPLPAAGPSGAARLRRTPRSGRWSGRWGKAPRAGHFVRAVEPRRNWSRAASTQWAGVSRPSSTIPTGRAARRSRVRRRAWAVSRRGGVSRSAQDSRPVSRRRHRSLRRRGSELAGRLSPRRRLRQLEVRFSSGAPMLSGTLTLPSGAGPAPSGRVRARLGVDRACLPARPAGAAGAQRRRRPGIRQARDRPVKRLLSRRVADRRRDRRPRPRCRRSGRFLGLSPRSIRPAWVSPATARPVGSCRWPGRVIRRSTSWSSSRPGCDRRRERPLPGPHRPGRAAGATDRRGDRRTGPRARAGWRRPVPWIRRSASRCSGSTGAATAMSPRVSRRDASSRSPRSGPRLHHCRLPAGEPRAGRDHDRPDGGDAPIRHVRPRHVRPGREWLRAHRLGG